MTNKQLSAKSVLESLIMKFKLHNSLIPSLLILSTCHSPKHQKCVKEIRILLCNNEEFLYSSSFIISGHSSLPSIMKTLKDLKRVLWSDETKINYIGSDGKVYVWKSQGEPLSDQTTIPIVKHRGVTTLWCGVL